MDKRINYVTRLLNIFKNNVTFIKLNTAWYCDYHQEMKIFENET